MALPTEYGNFLRKHDVQKAKYLYNRPYISAAVSAVFVFALAGAVTMGAALGYAYATAPVQTYDSAHFERAQALNTRISKSLSLVKAARPNDIDVRLAINSVSNMKPAGIQLEAIKIRPETYEVKGTVSGDISLVNNYAAALAPIFADKDVKVADIMSGSDGVKSFTITAKQMKKLKKAKISNKGGNK